MGAGYLPSHDAAKKEHMKYEVTIDIDLPRQRVLELWGDRSNYEKWQPSLVRSEHLEGEPGKVGAKTRLVQKMGRKEVEMLETIETLEHPESETLTYVANKVWNQVICRFDAIDDVKTRLSMSSEFECQGVMRVISRMFPGAFKKETKKHLMRFKSFAEREASN